MTADEPSDVPRWRSRYATVKRPARSAWRTLRHGPWRVRWDDFQHCTWVRSWRRFPGRPPC